MSQSLGTLFVDLQAETGGFVSALSKAATSAQSAAGQISKSFGSLQSIASQTFGAFGDLNPAISKIAFSLSSAGSAASEAMKELSGIGGAIGPIAALSAGAATGLAALAIGAAGIASHAAESAAKMYELSQSTGVNIETLSGFSYAAKTVGLDTQTLALGLERMSKSAFAAATAPAGASNAYTRLGVSVREAGGNIRPTGDILLSLADKFANMPDGILKSALAIQIFGRGGDALIPFLNKGSAGIKDLTDYVKAVGAELTGPAGAAAEEYSTNLAKIGIAAAGVENRLMGEMLPALQAVTAEMAKSAASGDSFGHDFISVLGFISKGLIVVADDTINWFEELGIAIKNLAALALDVFGALATAVMAAMRGDWAGVGSAVTEGLATANAQLDLFISESKSKFADLAKFSGDVFGKSKLPSAMDDWTTTKLPAGTFGPPPSDLLHDLAEHGGRYDRSGPPQDSGPQSSGRADAIAELVGKLQAQAAAEIALASATEKSAAASVLAKAAAEAETKIGEERTRLLEQEKSLRGELGDAQREGASGQSGGGERALKINAEIAGIQKMLAELQKDAPQIKSLYAEIAAGEFGTKASKDIEEFIVKTNEAAAAAREMAAAYAQGPLAVQQASEAAKIAPLEKQRADMGQLISMMQAAGQTVPAGLQQAYDQLGQSIDRAKTAESSLVAADISQEVAKESEELRAQAKAFEVVAAAALKSGEAQREAAAQAVVIKFQAEKPTATPGDLTSVYDTALAKIQQQHAETIAQAAAEEDLNVQYDRELEKLEEIRAFLVSSGQSTMQVDNAMWTARIQFVQQYEQQVMQSQNQELLGNAKLYDSQQQLIEQWDQAAMKVGNLSQQMGAFFSMVQQQGANLGEHVFSTLSKSIDDVSTQLADFVVTGKANFRELLRSLEEGLLKDVNQKIFSSMAGGIAKSLGLPTPQQQLGTAGNPMFVRIAGMLPMGGPGGPGGPGGSYSGPLADSSGSGFLSGLDFLPTVNGGSTQAGAAAGASSGSGFLSGLDFLPTVNGGSTQAGAAASPSSGISGFLRSILMMGMPKQSNGTPPTFPGPAYGLPAASGGAGGSLGLGALGSPANPMYVIQAPSAGLPGLPGSSGAPGAPGGMGGGIGGMFGLGGGSSLLSAPDGSQSSPFYVTMTSEMGGMGGMFGGGGGSGEGGGLFNMFGGDGDSSGGGLMDIFGGMGGMGGGMSEGGGGLFDMFGGGADAAAGGMGGLSDLMDFLPMLALESGGDVTPGNAYIVGEKRPEVFVPTTSGRIIPSFGEFARSAEAQAGIPLRSTISSTASGLSSSEKSFVSASLEKTSKSFANSTLKNSAAASIVSALPRREYGGSVTAGNPYMVGESRPEVFVPNSTPSNANASSSQGGAPQTVNNHVFHFHGVTDHDSFQKSQGQIYAEMRRELDKAHFRNNR